MQICDYISWIKFWECVPICYVILWYHKWSSLWWISASFSESFRWISKRMLQLCRTKKHRCGHIYGYLAWISHNSQYICDGWQSGGIHAAIEPAGRQTTTIWIAVWLYGGFIFCVQPVQCDRQLNVFDNTTELHKYNGIIYSNLLSIKICLFFVGFLCSVGLLLNIDNCDLLMTVRNK